MGVGRSPPESPSSDRVGLGSVRTTLERVASVGWLPAVVTVWFFAVQPSIVRFRLFTLQSTLPSSPEELPLRLVGVFAHVLFHDPTQRPPVHLLKNLGLFAVASVGFLNVDEPADAIRAVYARLVVLTPLVAAAVFVLAGQTRFGYGASAVGFALTGYVAGGTVFGGVPHRHRGLARAFVLYGVVIVAGDIATGGLATSLHTSGFAFGASYAWVSES
ncbi:hypothetical protein SAMN04488063_3084 [Halopelagius inordinatus]|uniref:Rhomboid family protein n=1 Tax=Halopelagius inordinatus TaxID=553467 RepID=A0A1I2VCG1_9EURY|nr:hypothetical protein [Halopelagius inordinatus]SFG84831.1 hypothetical protein SAMN04488063_3084 [Halopelagius inordinatus]